GLVLESSFEDEADDEDDEEIILSAGLWVAVGHEDEALVLAQDPVAARGGQVVAEPLPVLPLHETEEALPAPGDLQQALARARPGSRTLPRGRLRLGVDVLAPERRQVLDPGRAAERAAQIEPEGGRPIRAEEDDPVRRRGQAR